jgi:3-methyladenine DNA glycosylase AlkC
MNEKDARHQKIGLSRLSSQCNHLTLPANLFHHLLLMMDPSEQLMDILSRLYIKKNISNHMPRTTGILGHHRKVAASMMTVTAMIKRKINNL